MGRVNCSSAVLVQIYAVLVSEIDRMAPAI
jgi:hypothetical protein